ncbi:DUF3482 domain-containing protein [uncultured Methylibium sp.]|uniref:DUF3482 domain-containing protein n=1 Tax=uncultured Methylibium sp. TaxID=381093 RepID=UPI0025F369A0|nr:DUF3482 domain-containing protein [uncultured Methylibium sp.]
MQIALSLVSHTNVGKTTLARTLLRRDIGEVRDEAHVTSEAERHPMIESPAGDRLELWDTPGFGDSLRLAKRLAQRGNPLGWFMTEVWDRFRDRGFWHSQRAVRNVLEQADVVLYLVNASEAPEDSGYLDPELQVLTLIGKPVLVLLNQLGPPRPPADEAAQVEGWRRHLAGRAIVREVLALDAFARCWVQEGRLLQAIADALPAEPAARRAAFERLREAWDARSRTIFQAAMRVLAQRLARAARDREEVPDSGWTDKLKQLGSAMGLFAEGGAAPRERAMQALAQRLDADVRTSTDRLIRLHGLDGHATEVVLTRLAEHYAVREPLSEGKAALWGGAVAGALAGLKADIATGGMTLGGGLLAGGLLGALGAAGLAKGVNLVRGVDKPTLAWTDEVLLDLVQAALLGYLAVAHYGRGRGDWAEGEAPGFWRAAVDAAVDGRAEALRVAMRADDTDALAARLGATTTALLQCLYPKAA